MSAVLDAFRQAFSAAGKPIFIGQQTTGLSFGQWTQWFSFGAQQNQANLLAAYFKFSYTVSGTTITPVAGASVNDVVVQQVQVAAQANSSPKISVGATPGAHPTAGVENLEQAAFDVSYGYPRAAPSSTAGTYTGFFYVPVGGGIAAVRWQLAAATAGYSAGTVVLNAVTAYGIYGSNNTSVTASESSTPSLGTGPQDLHTQLSPNIAPTLISLVTDASTNITLVNLAGQNGTLIVSAADVDALTNGAAAVTPRTGALKQGTTILADDVVPSLFNVSFAAAGVHDVLEIQFAGSEVTNVPTKAETTPATPSAGMVGVPNAANIPVAANSRASGALGTIRRPRF